MEALLMCTDSALSAARLLLTEAVGPEALQPVRHASTLTRRMCAEVAAEQQLHAFVVDRGGAVPVGVLRDLYAANEWMKEAVGGLAGFCLRHPRLTRVAAGGGHPPQLAATGREGNVAYFTSGDNDVAQFGYKPKKPAPPGYHKTPKRHDGRDLRRFHDRSP